MTNAETTTAANVAEQGAHVAPETASSKKGASRKKNAPKGQKTAKVRNRRQKSAKAPQKPAQVARTPRPESKAAKILALVSRPKGATLAEIMKAADWQAHSVRGFISTAGKKHGLEIESSKTEDGERLYKVAK